MSTRIIALVIATSCALASRALADDAPIDTPFSEPPAFQRRLTDLEAWIHDYARQHKGPQLVRDPTKFCAPFTDWDMQGTIASLWGELSNADRRDLFPGLASLVESCGYSQGSAKRAGFAIDYMYWNRVADTTGNEVADALLIRDIFHEVYVNQLSQQLIEQNAAALAARRPPPTKDFLTAQPTSRIALAKTAAAVVDAVSIMPSSNTRESFNAMVDLVNFRTGYLSPFGNGLLQILHSADDLRTLKEFYRYLLYVQRNPRLLGELHGGWHKLMQITTNNPEQATRVFGVMASLLYMPLEDLAPALAARGELKDDYVTALHNGAMAYYLINQLDERSAKNSNDDDHSLVYHFFYPDSYTTTNWKWYHWFNNAYMGCLVAKRGYPKNAVVSAAGLLATFYEGATLNMVIPARGAIGLDPRANPILESYQDVDENKAGAAYGAELCSHRSRAYVVTVTFN